MGRGMEQPCLNLYLKYLTNGVFLSTLTLTGHPEDCGEILKKIDVFLGGFMKRTLSCQGLHRAVEALE